LLQEVLTGSDLLVVDGSAGGAERRAEDPGALVPDLVPRGVVPGVEERIGDRLDVLVADEVDRRVCVVPVRSLAAVARAPRGRQRCIRLVLIDHGAAAAREGAVVGAV